jgi:hypothetical protein
LNIVGRQAEAIGRDLAVAELVALAGANIRGGDEQLDRRLSKPREVDALSCINSSLI